VTRESGFLDKELDQISPQQEPEAPKFVDKLVRVYTGTGSENGY